MTVINSTLSLSDFSADLVVVSSDHFSSNVVVVSFKSKNFFVDCQSRTAATSARDLFLNLFRHVVSACVNNSEIFGLRAQIVQFNSDNFGVLIFDETTNPVTFVARAFDLSEDDAYNTLDAFHPLITKLEACLDA